MASNHTEHFSLNQWQADDQVKRTDFNEDNAKIDAALNDLSGGLAAAQAEKADQTALDALAAEVAKKATTAALEAVRAAVPKIAVGTYTGTGTYGDSKPDDWPGASVGPGAPANRPQRPDQMSDTDPWSGGGRLLQRPRYTVGHHKPHYLDWKAGQLVWRKRVGPDE